MSAWLLAGLDHGGIISHSTRRLLLRQCGKDPVGRRRAQQAADICNGLSSRLQGGNGTTVTPAGSRA